MRSTGLPVSIKERVSVLRHTIDKASFFDLRTDISPATQQFHRPHYSLGAKQHSER